MIEQRATDKGFDRRLVEGLADTMDDLGMALCLFDGGDRTVLWNRTFLEFFPEHAGHLHEGEPYRANLHRFYVSRLPAHEMCEIERYVADGIARHRQQSRPFVFQHRGRLLRVASRPLQEGWRLRVWTVLPNEDPVAACDLVDSPVPAADLFANLADGAAVLDAAGRIVAVNEEFLALYDVPAREAVLGQTFTEAVRQVWARSGEDAAGPFMAGFIDNARFAGAAFEVELPGGRWRRVIERRMADGTAYLSHADITILKRQQRELSEAYRQLETLAVTDSLTGLANRRRFEQMLGDWLGRVPRLGRGVLSLLVLDVDRFKRINDGHGHQAGDLCLQMVARALTGVVRPAEALVARIGGEEFAVVLPETGGAEAVALADAMRAAVEADRSGSYNRAVPVTVSVGIATVLGKGPAPGLDAVVAAADRALYRAKRAGRNRTVVADALG